MVRAQGDQVAEIVVAATRNRCDVMNIDFVIETAYDALVLVSDQNLIAHEFPFSAFPVSTQVGLFGIKSHEAQPIAKTVFSQLTRKSLKRFAAIRALHFNFLAAARFACQALPFSVTLVIAACLAYVPQSVLDRERLSAYAASKSHRTAFVVAVMFASMLMEIDVAVLPFPIFYFGYYFATAASAINDIGIAVASFVRGHQESPVYCVGLR